MYKVSIAGVSEALVIAVSIEAHLVRTAALWFVIAEGTDVPASVFLTMYQSVCVSIDAACAFTFLIFFVFKPSITTTGSKSLPSSSVAFASA